MTTTKAGSLEQALGEIWLGRHQFSLHTTKSFSELSQVSRFEGYSHQSRDHTEGVGGTTYLDLLQVDVLASGASLVWPRSGRPRATKSRAIWNPTKDFFESLLLTKCGTSRGGRGEWGKLWKFWGKMTLLTDQQASECMCKPKRSRRVPASGPCWWATTDPHSFHLKLN